MIGNPVNYDKKFKDNFTIFPAKFDPELKRYLNSLNVNEVLDFGGLKPHYSGVIKHIGKKTI